MVLHQGLDFLRQSFMKNNQNKKSIIVLFAVLALLAAAVFAGLQVWNSYGEEQAQELYGGIVDAMESHTATSQTSTQVNELPDNPIDFNYLKGVNDEIYAWIKIPSTKVDYPIVQSRVDDNFYLERSIQKQPLKAGSIFSQSHNRTDFSDPVTVLYGHNMRSGQMFANLHFFEDPVFFKENEFFNIYTPGHILTYRIVSSFKYDNRHIMNSFDFSKSADLEEFQKTVLSPSSVVKNVRDGVTLNSDSKLVVLSTCMSSSQKNSRYLVVGVLTSDEQTK